MEKYIKREIKVPQLSLLVRQTDDTVCIMYTELRLHWNIRHRCVIIG